MEDSSAHEEPKATYKSFDEMIKRVTKLKLSKWNVTLHLPAYIKLTQEDNMHTIPLYTLYVQRNFQFTLQVQGWALHADHKIYAERSMSLQHTPMTTLLNEIEQCFICTGINSTMQINTSSAIIRHSVPKLFDVLSQTITPICQSEYYRSNNCSMLIEVPGQCGECHKTEKRQNKDFKRKGDAMLIPAKLNAPVSQTAPGRIKLGLQQLRNENKLLKAEFTKLQAEIEKSSIEVSKELSDDITTIMMS